MKEIKEFWSDMFRDQDKNDSIRLKASEYLAKTQGAFLERVEVTSIEPVSVIIDYGEDD